MFIKDLKKLLLFLSTSVPNLRSRNFCSRELADMYSADIALLIERTDEIALEMKDSSVNHDLAEVLHHLYADAQVNLATLHHGSNVKIAYLIIQAATYLNSWIHHSASTAETPALTQSLFTKLVIPLSALPLNHALTLQQIKRMLTTDEQYSAFHGCEILLVGSQVYLGLIASLNQHKSSMIHSQRLMEQSDCDIRIVCKDATTLAELKPIFERLVYNLAQYKQQRQQCYITTDRYPAQFVTMEIGEEIDISLSSTPYVAVSNYHATWNLLTNHCIVPCSTSILSMTHSQVAEHLVVHDLAQSFSDQRYHDLSYQIKTILKFIRLGIEPNEQQLGLLQEIIYNEDVLRAFRHKYPKLTHEIINYLCGYPIIDLLILRLADKIKRPLRLQSAPFVLEKDETIVKPQTAIAEDFFHNKQLLSTQIEEEYDRGIIELEEKESLDIIARLKHENFHVVSLEHDETKQRDVILQEELVERSALLEIGEEFSRRVIEQEAISGTLALRELHSRLYHLNNEATSREKIIEAANLAYGAKILSFCPELTNPFFRTEQMARIAIITEANKTQLSFPDFLIAQQEILIGNNTKQLRDLNPTTIRQIISVAKGTRKVDSDLLFSKNKHYLTLMHQRPYIDDNDSPLELAIRSKSISVVAALLSNGVNVNCLASNGETAIRLLMKYNQDPAILSLLLSYGAVCDGVTTEQHPYAPLHDAVINNDTQLVPIFIQAGANPLAPSCGKSPNALFHALKSYKIYHVRRDVLMRVNFGSQEEKTALSLVQSTLVRRVILIDAHLRSQEEKAQALSLLQSELEKTETILCWLIAGLIVRGYETHTIIIPNLPGDMLPHQYEEIRAKLEGLLTGHDQRITDIINQIKHYRTAPAARL